MNILICGSRYLGIKTPELLVKDIKDNIEFFLENNYTWSLDDFIVGGAPGVDTWAEEVITHRGATIKVYPADWNKYGKYAGYLRNKQMVDVADSCLAIWDGKSPGTKNTIDLSLKKGIDVFILQFKLENYL